MNTLEKIEVDITVELGSATMPIHHLLRMGRGAIIELDTSEQDPLRIYANNTLIARGGTEHGRCVAFTILGLTADAGEEDR